MSLTVKPSLTQVARRADEVRTPGRPWTDVRRVVVARHDRLGDVVLSLPAVAALRRAYPDAELALWVRPPLLTLASMVRGIDVVLEAGPGRKAQRSALERFRPDLCVVISRGLTAAWAAWQAGVPHRVGAGHRLYSPLFHRRVAERRRAGGRHEVEYALSFAHRAGALGGPEDFELRVPAEATARIDAWMRSRDIDGSCVVLHPGSGGSCPAWPAQHYLELARGLHRLGHQVAWSIGPDDAAIAHALDAGGEPATRVFDGGLCDLAALLMRSALVIGSSTGPLHLAAAVGAPTLALHAPWATCGAGRWGPYADNGWALVAEAHGAARWSRARRRRDGSALLAALRPEAVLDCATKLLSAGGRSSS
jgi:ADP-heptose:LPS heptosyltransferase